jgi:hypothetical protein
LQFLRRMKLVPRAKRAPFYPLAPGLGKRAAMLFLKAACGEPGAICGADGAGSEGWPGAHSTLHGVVFAILCLGPAAHRPHRFEDARKRAMRLCAASGIRDVASGLRLFRAPGGTRLMPR